MTPKTDPKIAWLPYAVQFGVVCTIMGAAMFRLSAAEEAIEAIEQKEMPERMVRVETIVQANSDKIDDAMDTLKDNQALMQEILRKVSP